ncbi:ABC transporter substrate-binding protein [Paenibacillus thiaminolyticus]|uniref:ABC transporter substrate-binding protein n=1 Tax=Paenibacillus thiaminolyticus TaxID=49283 RepID=A0A3A3H0T3_PANTH|nr:ABC transporter substrate-binding protein [Paenibacillus thiaminolyticus]RJG24586.1 ABC transporter substrate-binding protein [Paenibacillus thiaminolyticus]
MKRRRLGFTVLAVLLLGSAMLGACGGKSDKVKLKVGEVTRSIFYAPEYVAMGKGFFEEEGLEVELQTTFGGDKTMTALLSGAIDIALVGSETSVYVAQQGAEDPVINFAQLTQTDGTFLMARHAEGTFDWNDLKGKVFLGQRKGGMPQMAGEFTLKKHGIDPHGDLELIQNIDFANVAFAFASGTGEYVQLFEPQASIFEKEGRGAVVASFGVESGLLPYTVFMTKQSHLTKNKEAIQKFTNAVYKAQKWVESESPEAIADVIMPFFKDTEREIVVSSLKRYKEQGSFAADPLLDDKEWSNLLDVLDSAGELKERIEYSRIVNNEFAEEAKRQVK